MERFFEQKKKLKELYKQYTETQIKANKDVQKAQECVAKAIFKEMYDLVCSTDNCTIIVNSNDVKAIAKRYGVKL